MRIGEFAKAAGVSTSKVRFYEAQGLLPAASRSANGYRRYDAGDLRVIAFIGKARALGFSLADVARFMARPAADRRAKTGLVEQLQIRLQEIDDHIREARARRRQLVALIDELKAARQPRAD